MKKSFTLFEIVVVVLIISIIYYFSLSSLNFNTPKKDNIQSNIENLKSSLLKIDYEDEIKLSCIKDASECYLFIDGKLDKKTKIKSPFKRAPEVFEYNNDLNRIEYPRIKLGDFQDFKVDFQIKLNKYKKHKDFIVDAGDNKVYLFSPFYEKAIKYKYVNEALDDKEDKQDEVKDAF